MSTPVRSSLALALAVSLWGCRAPRPSDPASSGGAQYSAAEQRQVLRKTAAPVLELRFVFDAGSRDDPQGLEGLTHVMLTSMLEGRAGNLSYADRARALYPMAAEIDGYVGRDQTVIVARVHRDHVPQFYPLLRDVLLAPAFDAADVERVRTRTLSSLTQDLRGSDDEELGKQALQAMLYEGESRAHPELGSESGLRAIHASEARAQWQRVVCESRLLFALSGDIQDEFLQALRADLSSLQRPECQVAKPSAAWSPSYQRRFWLIDKPEAQSVAISIGVPLAVERSHADYAALTLAAAYLGQHRTFSGQLMQKMREQRGLNYGDYAYAEHFQQDGETRFPLPNVARRKQYFSLWIRPVPREKAHFALRMALREYENFVQQGLSKEELERTQRFAERYYALYAQTEQQRMGELLDDRFYGASGPYLDALRAAFRALTVEQVNQAIRRHLSLERVQVAMVVPDAPTFRAALLKDEPSPITYSSEKSASLLEEDKQIASYPLKLSESEVQTVPLNKLFY